MLSVVGTRPNMMKIAPIAAVLRRDPALFEHVLVHTGQHYDHELSAIFLEEFELGEPVALARGRLCDTGRAGGARDRAPRARAGLRAARRRARARRRQLDRRSRPDRSDPAHPGRARRGGAAELRPDDARGAEPDRGRHGVRPALHALARGSREPAARGAAGGGDPRCRQHDDRHAGGAPAPLRVVRRGGAPRSRAGQVRRGDVAPSRALRRRTAAACARGGGTARTGAAGRLSGAPAHAPGDRPARLSRAHRASPCPAGRVRRVPQPGRGLLRLS